MDPKDLLEGPLGAFGDHWRGLWALLGVAWGVLGGPLGDRPV